MKRGILLGAAFALFVATAAAAMPPRGSRPPASGATPHISYSPPALTAPIAPGTPAGTAMISGLSGGTWSMTPATSFGVNSSTGLVSATATVNAGNYTPTLTYTGTAAGETIAVSLTTNIVVGGGVGGGGLFFPSGSNLITAAAVF